MKTPILKKIWFNCPFHKDKIKSFVFYLKNKSFYCFSCKRKGNIGMINYINNFINNLYKKIFAISYIYNRRIFNSYIIYKYSIGFCSYYFLDKNIKNRIIFPIKDINGKVCAIIARSLYHTRCKYMLIPLKSNFKKKNFLYGLYENKRSILLKNEVFVVEGSFDLLSMDKNRINNVVSTLGSNFNKNQIEILLNICNKITVVYDDDCAGKKSIFQIPKEFESFITVFFLKPDPDKFFFINNKRKFLFLKEKKEIFLGEYFRKKNFICTKAKFLKNIQFKIINFKKTKKFLIDQNLLNYSYIFMKKIKILNMFLKEIYRCKY
ncbi:toprim domain-containing protein [Candidatus Vidania fulgoroideorum]